MEKKANQKVIQWDGVMSFANGDECAARVPTAKSRASYSSLALIPVRHQKMEIELLKPRGLDS